MWFQKNTICYIWSNKHYFFRLTTVTYLTYQILQDTRYINNLGYIYVPSIKFPLFCLVQLDSPLEMRPLSIWEIHHTVCSLTAEILLECKHIYWQNGTVVAWTNLAWVASSQLPANYSPVLLCGLLDSRVWFETGWGCVAWVSDRERVCACVSFLCLRAFWWMFRSSRSGFV